MRGGVRITALFACAAALALASCKPPGQRWWEKLGQEQAPAPKPVSAGPLVPDDATGLEVRVVPVRDGDNAVGRALARYETVPVRAEPVLLDRWRRAGLRIVAVPDAELESVLDALEPAGVIDSNWWADATEWQVIARGPSAEGASLRTGTGVELFEPGRTGVMMRSWLEPVLGRGTLEPAMRVELVPVNERRVRRGATRDLMLGAEEDPRRVLASLALGVSARGEFAYVIVGEAPDLVWGDLPEPAPDAPDAAEPEEAPRPGPTPGGQAPSPDALPGAPGPSGTGARSGALGPAKPAIKTFGEHTLVIPPTLQRSQGTGEMTVVRPGAKILVVVRPRLGALAPDPPRAQGDAGS